MAPLSPRMRARMLLKLLADTPSLLEVGCYSKSQPLMSTSPITKYPKKNTHIRDKRTSKIDESTCKYKKNRYFTKTHG